MAKKIRLILASASPRRRLLLNQLHIPFRILASHVSEKSSQKNPVKLVEELALRKANATARMVRQGIIIGADTVVVWNRKILGKPRHEKDAFRMLSRLSGSTNHVVTGVAVVDAATGKSLVSHAVSVVRMKKMAPDAIHRLSKKHLDKAGAYAIQEKRDPIARVVKGSYDNVVGLPVKKVREMLRRFEITT